MQNCATLVSWLRHILDGHQLLPKKKTTSVALRILTDIKQAAAMVQLTLREAVWPCCRYILACDQSRSTPRHSRVVTVCVPKLYCVFVLMTARGMGDGVVAFSVPLGRERWVVPWLLISFHRMHDCGIGGPFCRSGSTFPGVPYAHLGSHESSRLPSYLPCPSSHSRFCLL